MKVIKVKVYYTQDAQGTHYGGGYPPEWDAQRIGFIVYCQKDRDQKGTFQWVLATVPDDLYQKMIKNKERCFPVTKEEAIELGNKFRPKREVITDQYRIMKILLKKTRGEKLTPQEEKAIDPDHPERGVNRTKSVEEIWKEQGVTW